MGAADGVQRSEADMMYAALDMSYRDVEWIVVAYPEQVSIGREKFCLRKHIAD
jgi:hypothetical protein